MKGAPGFDVLQYTALVPYAYCFVDIDPRVNQTKAHDGSPRDLYVKLNVRLYPF